MKASRNIGAGNAGRVRDERKKLPSAESLAQGVLKGDRTALGRALTLIESTKEEDQYRAHFLIGRCLEKVHESIRIGITGIPGVGKSTFIEAFAALLTSMANKVAVLAIDPTSTRSKGSILGDKTRMPGLVRDPNAFIRPSPSGAAMGGVARKTREGIILCEAAGYDIILVETVGAGQSDVAVHGMVDFFLLLQLAGTGDELQGIKRGIIEMADAIAINKSDGSNIKKSLKAKAEIEHALHLYPPKTDGWVPRVLTCSALQREGILEIWELISKYISAIRNSGKLAEKRREQNKDWFLHTLNDLIKDDFYRNPGVQKHMDRYLCLVEKGKKTPFRAAEELLEYVHSGG